MHFKYGVREFFQAYTESVNGDCVGCISQHNRQSWNGLVVQFKQKQQFHLLTALYLLHESVKKESVLLIMITSKIPSLLSPI